MPKKSKKTKSKGKANNRPKLADNLGDVTLNEYANNEVKRNSCQKRTSVLAIKNEVHTMKISEDDRAWDEKDDEEFEISNSFEHSSGMVQGKRKYCTWGVISEAADGIDLPLDIWFLISEHIRPEDVANFGAICYATFYVVSTARFWKTLYGRYQKLMPGLPEELMMWNMDRVRGLKANVIRALFYLYPPYHARIVGEKPLTADPTRLLRTECLLQWHVKVGSLFKYYFKFAKPNQNKKKILSRHGLPNIMSVDSLVHVNPDLGCYILEAVTPSVCAVPMVMGEYLHHAGLGVSADLSSHRLHLSLAPAHLLPRPSTTKSRKFQVPYKEVLLEPVRDVRVYPWWHPQYYQKRGR